MKFNKLILKNGLTILHEKRDVPVTTVMLGTKFGAIYESETEKGIAHYIEHLCFKGTKKRTTRQIAFELEKVGGLLNAFTSDEETAYHVKLPSDYLELAMDVIFDIFFNPLFPEVEVKKEGNVICEELRMYNDNPRLHVIDKIKSSLYKGSFGMGIGGTEKTVRTITRDQLLEKHKQVYNPENSILVVVGNNNFEDIVKFAEQFCPERKGEQLKIPKIEFQNLKIKETRKDIQQANLTIGVHFPKMSDKERYISEIVGTFLGGGMSSKLFTEVREKRGLAYAVKTDIDNGKEYGYLIIYIGTDREKVDEVIKICIEELKKVKNISEEELEDTKKQLIGNYEIESEDSAKTALHLILEEISGNAKDYYEYEKNINSVTLKDVKEFVSKIKDYSYYALTP